MILIGMGANLPSRYGSPRDTLLRAKESLVEAGLPISSSSAFWRSAPVPVQPGSPWYVNCVVTVQTQLPPTDLLDFLLKTEKEIGRVRSCKNAPRVIDLDLLCYDGLLYADEKLDLPHPRLHQRAFVLLPLKEICPHWVHPSSGRSLDELITDLPKGQKISRL